jgi:hypothetical protein
MTTCPHCLSAGCVHCHELQVEQSRLRRRSLLTDNDRRTLCLFVRPLIIAAEQKRPAAATFHGTRPPAVLHNSVLPANFHL